MIKIDISIDSVESMDGGVTYSCDWNTSGKLTKVEEFVSKLILSKIREAFDDITTQALVTGGSVMRADKELKKGDNGKGQY